MMMFDDDDHDDENDEDYGAVFFFYLSHYILMHLFQWFNFVFPLFLCIGVLLIII